jgi:hypothetical protein
MAPLGWWTINSIKISCHSCCWHCIRRWLLLLLLLSRQPITTPAAATCCATAPPAPADAPAPALLRPLATSPASAVVAGASQCCKYCISLAEVIAVLPKLLLQLLWQHIDRPLKIPDRRQQHLLLLLLLLRVSLFVCVGC